MNKMFNAYNEPVPELIDKIKQVKTEEELAALAKEAGIDFYNPLNNRDFRRKYKMLRYTDITLKPEIHNMTDEVKYDFSKYRFDDAGIKGDPVPEGFVIFDLFDVEFLVGESIAANLTADLKRPEVKHFMDLFSCYYHNCEMHIGVDVKNMPYISSFGFRHEPENLHVYGVDVIAEKGTFDVSSEKDMAILEKLTDHYKEQRVVLWYEGENPGISVNDARMRCYIPSYIVHRDSCWNLEEKYTWQ